LRKGLGIGCPTKDDAVRLAPHSFEVTGADVSKSANEADFLDGEETYGVIDGYIPRRVRAFSYSLPIRRPTMKKYLSSRYRP